MSLPTVSPHIRYREALAEGRLLFQRCAPCGNAIFPPRVVCPACGGEDLAAEDSAGAGEIYSVTAVTRRDHDSYTVCLINLDEGFRMMSTVVDAVAEDVRIGSRVRFAPEGGEVPRAVFVIASER